MTCLFQRPVVLSCRSRAFSTTARAPVSLHIGNNDRETLEKTVPEYPYGPARWYKQSDLGLYGGSRIHFGNNVTGPFDIKTRRTWHPNVKTRRLFSKALNRFVQIRVTTRVLRTIDKVGGLDEYLLGEKEARIKELGETGWWLRWAIMQTPSVQERFAKQREAVGLPAYAPPPIQTAQEPLETSSSEVETPTSSVEESTSDRLSGVDEDAKTSRRTRAIRFRVDRRRHVVLRPHGWSLYRPTTAKTLETMRSRTLLRAQHRWTVQRLKVFNNLKTLRMQHNARSLEQLERFKEELKSVTMPARQTPTVKVVTRPVETSSLLAPTLETPLKERGRGLTKKEMDDLIASATKRYLQPVTDDAFMEILRKGFIESKMAEFEKSSTVKRIKRSLKLDS